MPQLIVNTGANGWMFSSQPTTVQPHITQLQVGKLTSSTMRTLLRFGLTALPIDAQVTSASLQIWQQNGATPNPAQAVHRVKTPWHEDQATWNNRLTGTPWLLAGGDIFSSPTAALWPVQFTLMGGNYIESDVTALVELVVGGDALNLLVRNVSEASGTARVFYDPFAGAHPPILTVDYALPAAGSQRLSLGMGVGV